MRKQLQEKRKTGGGQNEIVLTPTEQRVVDLTGMSTAVLGVAGFDFGAESPLELIRIEENKSPVIDVDENREVFPKRYRPATQSRVLVELQSMKEQNGIIFKELLSKLEVANEISAKRLKVEEERLNMENRRLEIEEKMLEIKLTTEAIYI